MKLRQKTLFVICLSLCFLILSQAQLTAKGKPARETYDFKIAFNGNFPLAPEGIWTITSPVGGTGNIGPSPPNEIDMYLDPDNTHNIAIIGDDDCACSGPCDTCENRIVGRNIPVLDITVRNADDLSIGTNMEMGFKIQVQDDGTLYTYSVGGFCLSDLTTYPWDPSDPSFCVPIDCPFVSILQLVPTVKQKDRKECDRGETCEAKRLDYPLSPEDHTAVIWRAEQGSVPPCGF